MRLLLAIHRFGPDVVGGAERLALDYARRLAALGHALTVATTRARDYRTWRDDYPAGASHLDEAGVERAGAGPEGAVAIQRFSVARERTPLRFALWSKLAHRWPANRALSLAWMRAQGPDSPGLARWAAENAGSFDAVLLFNYLYYATWSCIPACADRALLVPLAHDEPPLRLAAYAELFRAPSAILWSSRTERDLLVERFGETGLPRLFQGGAGIELGAAAQAAKADSDAPNHAQTTGPTRAGAALRAALEQPGAAAWLARQSSAFAEAARSGRFFLSLGRVAEGKDADLLARQFAEAAEIARVHLLGEAESGGRAEAEGRRAFASGGAIASQGDLGGPLPPLLMVGPMELRDPAAVSRSASVIASNGPAPDGVAAALRRAALATLHASRHESLNLSAAESLAAGAPVLARTASRATVELVEESGCGGVWGEPPDLARLLVEFANRDAATRADLARRASDYARAKFDWSAVLDRLEEALRFVAAPPRP